MSDPQTTARPASSCCGDQSAAASPCCGGATAAQAAAGPPADATPPRRLNIELLVIDLESCARCVPTGEQLRNAIELVAPAAEAQGIGLTYRETVVQTPEEAKARALLSSPTIRINGRDIDQDIRESECESCGDLTENDVSVDCREWHYKGEVYSAAPLPFLVETLMDAMLKLDEQPPVTPEPIADLPENLQRYFANKKPAAGSGCCC
jgi:hypothetical protein